MNKKNKKESHLHYISSIVLGLNDATVEMTGAIVGLTMAFSNNFIVGISAFTTGIAASLSMASSEYLSKRANNSNDSLIHSIYTGIAYLVCVIILVLPYLLNFKYALVFSLFNAFLIILIFNYVICKIKKTKFFKKFLEMFLISSVISLISFLCGTLIKNYFNLNI